jgi:hypothetical protein
VSARGRRTRTPPDAGLAPTIHPRGARGAAPRSPLGLRAFPKDTHIGAGSLRSGCSRAPFTGVRGSVLGGSPRQATRKQRQRWPVWGKGRVPARSTVLLASSRKMNPLDLRQRSTDRGRCGHDAVPVRVLPVVGGKKIAHCPGCGRSGPARASSADALAALRGTQRPYFMGPPTAVGGWVTGSKR